VSDPAPESKPAKKPLLARWSVRIFLGLVVLAGAGLLLRNVLVRAGLETAVTEVTGFPLTIDEFDLGLTTARVEVGGMRLSNPEGFEDPRCIDVPRLVADVELASAFGEELHVREIDLHVAEVVVVRNAKGETNLDRLSALGGGGKEGGEGGGEGKEAAGPAKETKWKCDLLRLRLGRVVMLDYSGGGKPSRDEWELDVDEEFRDLDGPGAVVRVLVWQVLKKTPVKLLRASAEQLAKEIGGTLKKGVGTVIDGVGGAVEGIGKGLGGLLGGDDDGKKEEKKPPKRRR
jgi:hypothetical protein